MHRRTSWNVSFQGFSAYLVVRSSTRDFPPAPTATDSIYYNGTRELEHVHASVYRADRHTLRIFHTLYIQMTENIVENIAYVSN